MISPTTLKLRLRPPPLRRLLRPAWAWLLSVSLSAQTAPPAGLLPTLALKRMSVEELLTQQVVSASRRPEAWASTASDLFLIRDRAVFAIGAHSLPELLRLAPNLFVAQKSSLEWAVNARGFVRTNSASNKLLVMIDGRTVYSPLFSNVFWEATNMFLPDLERIEVISGPAGSNWGANAVNGVISIQSKSAHDTLGGLLTATAGTEVQSFGARYGARVGESGALRVYVQGADYDSTLSGTGAADHYDDGRSVQTGFRADWGENESGAFTLQSDLFGMRYRSNPEIGFDNFHVLGRWARDLTPDSEVWIRSYFDSSKNHATAANHEESRTADLEFQHRLKLGEHQNLLWGGNYRHIQDSIHDTAGFAIVPADLDFALGSVFAQHEVVTSGGGFKLTSGIRLEHNYYSGWEYLPSVRLAWKLSDQLLWVAASRAARIPSRFDVDYYAPATPPYFIVTGGPGFRAEIVQAYELGWRSQPVKSVSLTATAYFHDYDHLRSVEPSGPAVIPVTIGNKVAGRSYGLEVFADWDVNAWWRLRAGGFVMNQQTWLTGGGADLEGAQGEGSFPAYQAQLRNTFRLGKAVTWWTSLRRVAAVPAYDGGNGTVPAYTELDLSLNWVVRADLELSVSGRNLLDASHPEIGGLTARREIERSVQTAFRYKF